MPLSRALPVGRSCGEPGATGVTVGDAADGLGAVVVLGVDDEVGVPPATSESPPPSSLQAPSNESTSTIPISPREGLGPR